MNETSLQLDDRGLLYLAESAASDPTESGKAAVDRLRAIGPEGFARLQELAEEDDNVTSGRRTAFCGVACALALAWVIGSGDVRGLLIAGLLAAVLALIAFLFFNLFGESALQRKVVDALIAVDDPAAAVPLVSCLKFTGGQTRRRIVRALTHLLPRLGKEGWSLLTLSQRSQLYQQMNMALAMRDPDFVIAILELLRLHGDREALPRVAWLVVCEAPTAHEQQVREAARVCLDYMRRRIDFGTVAAIGPNATRFNLQRDSSANWDALIDARLALTHLLPQMQPRDAGLLAPEERKALHFALMWGWDGYGFNYANLGPEFHLELLSALARNGDTQALPYVREVAYGEAATPDTQRIRSAAKICLRTLEEQAAREQIGQTLLRASAAPAPNGDNLLRPATGSSCADPEELLRAVPMEDRKQ